MKVQGLDGRTYNWKLDGLRPLGGDKRGRSSYHLLARKILTELFPFDMILEEAYLPGCDRLYIDFFLPAYRMVVEANGPQHYKYSSHFHGSKAGFRESLARDRKKAEWCELNELILVPLAYNETEDEWRRKIINAKIGKVE